MKQGMLAAQFGSADGEAAELRRQLGFLQAQLSEAEHRFKNHLQLLAALARRDGADPQLSGGDVAKELTRRIFAISAASGAIEEREPREGASGLELLQRICTPYGEGSIRLQIDCDPTVEIPRRQATSVAMIVNEAVCNSLKHAFEEGPGEISVELTRVSGAYKLEVRDSGRGWQEDKRSSGRGLQLISAFVRQLNGTLTLSRSPAGGAALDIWFPA